jgi:O-antigen ligase
MKQHHDISDMPAIALSQFDTAIEIFLICLLGFMPLAFGVVHRWSEEVVIIVSGVLLVCLLLKLLVHPEHKLVWTGAYIPVAFFLLVAVFQLVPLPASLVGAISPSTVALRKELLGDLPESQILLKRLTLSFYSNATRHDLCLVLSVAAIFIVVLNVFRRQEQIKRLLLAISIIGGFIAVITVLQSIFGNDRIYGFVPSRYGKSYSGPFINHSNYGQFMNLSIGAALALAIVKFREAFAGRKLTPLAIFEYLASRSSAQLWLLVAIVGIGAGTVFASLTRGGMFSMLVAAVFTVLLFVSRRSFRGGGWLMVVTALVAFVCVVYVGFDAVYERLATLRNFHHIGAVRLQMVKDAIAVWAQFPAFGTGLGTHSVVYPMFGHLMTKALSAYAENEYAQALEETGLVGLGLLLIFVIIVSFSYVKNIRHGHKAMQLAVYGLGFGLLAILLHSFTDFGQHLPANAALSATFCALILVLAGQATEDNYRRRSFMPRPCRTLSIFALLVGVSLVWAWAIVGADRARVAADRWNKVAAIEKALAKKNWQGTQDEYSRLISAATAAAACEPQSVKYRHWLNVYRWHSISQLTDPDTGGLVVPEDLISTVHDIIAELDKVRAICPTYGPTYSIQGQIKRFVLNDPAGAELVRKGFRLAPSDPVACFVAGYLDIFESKPDDCVAKFDRAVKLDGNLFPAVVDMYVIYLIRPDLAISAAGDDIGRLTCVIDVLENMQYYDLAEQTRGKLRALLAAKCSRPGAAASDFAYLGSIYKLRHNNNAAIDCYRRALALDYGRVEWRLELARLLADEQRIPEAVREAKICLQLRPQLKAAENLVADFSVHPSALTGEIKSP